MTQREILYFAMQGALHGMHLSRGEKEHAVYKAAYEEIESMIDDMELEEIFYASHGYLPSNEEMEEMRRRWKD